MAAPKGNRYAANDENFGRPPIYETAEDLHNACEAYFEWVKGEMDTSHVSSEGDLMPPEQKWIRKPENITITGLALFLGFESRSTFYDYAKNKSKVFSYIIKKSALRVEGNYEQNLHSPTPTGSIFALKNMGWVDRVATENRQVDKEGNDVLPSSLTWGDKVIKL